MAKFIPAPYPIVLLNRDVRYKRLVVKPPVVVTIRTESKPQYPLHTSIISIASSFVATVFTAPLNALKLLAIENNLNSFRTLLAYLFAHRITIASLYRGYWTGMLKFGPRHAIEHTLFDALKHTPIPTTLAGVLSTATSATLLQPLDNVHIRRVLQRPSLTPTTAFNGVAPALLQSTLSGLIYYSTLQHFPPSTTHPFLACGISSILINAILHPLDVIKTHCSLHDTCAIQTTRRLLNSAGIRGLYKGFPLVLATSVPSHAIAYGTYTLFKHHLSANRSS